MPAMTAEITPLPGFTYADCVATEARIVSEHARWHLEQTRRRVAALAAQTGHAGADRAP